MRKTEPKVDIFNTTVPFQTLLVIEGIGERVINVPDYTIFEATNITYSLILGESLDWKAVKLQNRVELVSREPGEITVRIIPRIDEITWAKFTAPFSVIEGDCISVQVGRSQPARTEVPTSYGEAMFNAITAMPVAPNPLPQDIFKRVEIVELDTRSNSIRILIPPFIYSK